MAHRPVFRHVNTSARAVNCCCKIESSRYIGRALPLPEESMTPDELKSNQDFITGALARLAAAQERDSQARLDFQKEFRTWMRRLAEIQAQQADLLVHQSERMDYTDKRIEHMDQGQEEFRQEFRRLVHLLNMILDRLPPAA
jgi:hypothetical protein